MKKGMVLEGGAFRGLFTAGVMDFLIENNVEFQYSVGVSAGAGNQMGYVTKQIGRMKKVTEASGEDAYFGLKQMKFSRKFLNLERMFLEFPYNQYPFYFDKFFQSETKCEFVVSCCETGKAEYIVENSDDHRLALACMASCSVPLLCAPVEIDGKHYLDGSITDSIPVQKALDAGCDKILVVLTKPAGGKPTDYTRLKNVMGRYRKTYPNFYEAMMSRNEMYDKQKKLLEKLVEEKVVYLIRPTVPSIKKFENDNTKLDSYYQHGYDLMKERFDGFNKFF